MDADRPWVAPLRQVAGATGRVVVIPHAGAGPHALMPVVRQLPLHVEVHGVTLPGRERRHDECPRTSLSDPGAAVRAVLAELAALPPLPTVLLGHSMGAAFAATVAQTDPSAVAGQVLSAFPSTGSARQRAGRWSDDELIELLVAGGGTPDGVVTSPTWRRHLLDLLRNDLTFGMRLALGVDLRRLLVPTAVFAGSTDIVAPPPDQVGWGPDTELTLVTGGHFYLLEPPAAAMVAARAAALCAGVCAPAVHPGSAPDAIAA